MRQLIKVFGSMLLSIVVIVSSIFQAYASLFPWEKEEESPSIQNDPGYLDYLPFETIAENPWTKNISYTTISKYDYTPNCSVKLVKAEEDHIVFQIIMKYSTGENGPYHYEGAVWVNSPYSRDNSIIDPDIIIMMPDKRTAYKYCYYKCLRYNATIIDAGSSLSYSSATGRYLNVLWSIEGKENCNELRKTFTKCLGKGKADFFVASTKGTYYNGSKEISECECGKYGDGRSTNVVERVLASGGTGECTSLIYPGGRIDENADELYMLPVMEIPGYTHKAYYVEDIY